MLPAVEQLPAGSLERLQRIHDAVNALISPDPLRRKFFGHERIVNTALGSRRFRIDYRGPGGHSWSAFGVANPVHAADPAQK